MISGKYEPRLRLARRPRMHRDLDGPTVPEGREPASVTGQPSDHLYARFASLEWKLGCHMAEWKAARELAYRTGKTGDELNRTHCDGVVRLLREHLEDI
jgi:hypothetical protein